MEKIKNDFLPNFNPLEERYDKQSYRLIKISQANKLGQ